MRHIVTALLLGAALCGACSKHPTPEEEKKQEEADQARLMQKMLESQIEQELARRDGGVGEGGPGDASAK